jgi:hypothetical protein
MPRYTIDWATGGHAERLRATAFTSLRAAMRSIACVVLAPTSRSSICRTKCIDGTYYVYASPSQRDRDDQGVLAVATINRN